MGSPRDREGGGNSAQHTPPRACQRNEWFVCSVRSKCVFPCAGCPVRFEVSFHCFLADTSLLSINQQSVTEVKSVWHLTAACGPCRDRSTLASRRFRFVQGWSRFSCSHRARQGRAGLCRRMAPEARGGRVAVNSRSGWSSVSREELLSGVCLAGSCSKAGRLDSWDRGGRPVEPAQWLTRAFLFLVDRMP